MPPQFSQPQQQGGQYPPQQYPPQMYGNFPPGMPRPPGFGQPRPSPPGSAAVAMSHTCFDTGFASISDLRNLRSKRTQGHLLHHRPVTILANLVTKQEDSTCVHVGDESIASPQSQQHRCIAVTCGADNQTLSIILSWLTLLAVTRYGIAPCIVIEPYMPILLQYSASKAGHNC